jgi:flagellar assembly protein FliH
MTDWEVSSAVAAGRAGASRVGAWAPADLLRFVESSETAGPSISTAAVEAAERRAAEQARAHQAELSEALERGREEGRREESARLQQALAAAHSAIDEVRGAEAVRLEAFESNLAALAVAVARHVMGRELSADGAGIIADLVRQALTHFPVNQPVRVRVHPADLSLISAVAPDHGGPIPIGPGREVRWLADPQVQRGGCVVEGTDRLVDGRVDLALERVYRALVDG